MTGGTSVSMGDDSRIPDRTTPRPTALWGKATHLWPECGREGPAQGRPRAAGSAGTFVAAVCPGCAATRHAAALVRPRQPGPRICSPFEARLF